MLAAGLAALLVLAGALAWFLPYLSAVRGSVADVPTPSALYGITEYPVPPKQEACMASVTVEPTSGLAEFELRPAKPTPAGGPPVELVLTAPGYRGTMHVPGGYPGGGVSLPLSPSPSHSVIAQACFINRGTSTVLLNGTAEGRTVARSSTTIDGRSVVGDIALTFLQRTPSSLMHRFGAAVEHISNLTGGLLPGWLIWVLTVLIALGVPGSALVAFYLALREDEVPVPS